jgi:hypothetical protein
VARHRFAVARHVVRSFLVLIKLFFRTKTAWWDKRKIARHVAQQQSGIMLPHSKELNSSYFETVPM